MSNLIMVSFDLGESQKRKLSSAVKNGTSCTLRLSESSIGKGTTKLACTESQVKKLAKSKKLGVGCQLTFSATNLQYSAKHGSGFFSNLAGSAVSGLGNFVGNKIKGGSFRPANMVPYYGMPQPLKPKFRGRGFGSFLRNLAGDSVIGLSNVAGNVIKGAGAKRKTKGKGLKEDLIKQARKGAAYGVEKSLEGLGSYLGKKIRGNGVLPPGFY